MAFSVKPTEVKENRPAQIINIIMEGPREERLSSRDVTALLPKMQMTQIALDAYETDQSVENLKFN
jgi:hypothetical protein